MKKVLFPIGIDDYKELIVKGYAHIDKTLLIQEFWEESAKVILVTRPRRFGKTISLSMMQYFFEKTKEDNSPLFTGTQIWESEFFRKLQGQFPVIFLSFKDVRKDCWEDAYSDLQRLLSKEVSRTLTPHLHHLSSIQKKEYTEIIEKSADLSGFENSLQFMTEVLEQLFQKKVIVLIDEYDAPITHAYLHNYLDKMVGFMRNLLSKALKGNKHLERGFLTGVVRTAKDGIMSGLNNLKICTVLQQSFSDKFGFTSSEVESLLLKTGLLHEKNNVQSWYNGYTMGIEQSPTLVYNPWSVIAYLDSQGLLKKYWSNTGDTTLLEQLIADSDGKTREELSLLMEGKFLENKLIDENVTILQKQEPWSFLLFAGYLTVANWSFQNNKHYYCLKTPNKEIDELYKELVLTTISKTFSSSDLSKLHQALLLGDVEIFSNLLQNFVSSLCSYHDLRHDDPERSLHLFVLGLLASLSDSYLIDSNLESGNGRFDIMLCPKNGGKAAILEFKKGDDLHLAADKALFQIQDKNYKNRLHKLGYHGEIFCYGIASYKKEVLVKKLIA